MAQKIEIVRGTSNTLEINIVDANGTPYALESGEKLVFGIKKNPEHKEVIFAKVGTSIQKGLYQVDILPEDTEGLKSGTYYYDVSIESGVNFYNVIELTQFVLLANVTSRGCTE